MRDNFESDSKAALFCASIAMLLIAGAVQAGDGVNQAAAKDALLRAYPGLFTISGNTLTWNDGTTMIWDDGKQRTAAQLNESPDIEDMFHYVYPPASAGAFNPARDFDPGRVRYKPFFKKLYGASAQAVSQHIVGVKWLPKLSKAMVRVTTIFGIDRRLAKISARFEAMPANLSSFGLKPGGGFNWRLIAGTDHLSMHAFGSAIDINVAYSDNWRWHKLGASGVLPYKNRIPMAIVALFEKYGFIWGGRWYHYDTMHFEYRPELLLYRP
jgi:peptidoglycan L-alanyl-D-glutamate endopeptidase CwlK